MNPPFPPTDRTAGQPPAPLSTPAVAEAQRTELGRALENYLAPLLTYCEHQEADDNLGQADFQHTYALREAIAALLRYDQATEQLLIRYRVALTAGQELAAAQVPGLEKALGLPERSEALAPGAPAWAANPNPTPAELLAEREAEPLYRLGFVRGHARGLAQGQQQYQRLASLYAQYAILVPPPTYQPSPLVSRLTAYLDSPAAQQYAGLPLATRQALNDLTPADLRAYAES